MDVRTLDTFVRVARSKSFAAVARQEEVDPSSVSRLIAALEDELGLRLFQRTTRSLALTEEGEHYFQRIEPLVQELHQAGNEISRGVAEPRGVLRITSSVAFGERVLVGLMKEFLDAHPGLKPELIMSDQNLDLVSNRIDLGIRLGDGIEGDLIASRWLATRYHVCATPDYIASNPKLSEPEDLADHKCLVFTLPEFRSSWQFQDRSGQTRETKIESSMAISNALALRRAAIEGLGPALLADWLVGEDIRQGRLVDLFPDWRATATSFDTGVWFVYPSRSYLPNKVRVTIDYFREKLT